MEERWEGEQKGAGKYVSWETDHQAPRDSFASAKSG